MRRALWILAVATLVVEIALLLFGTSVERALIAANWPPLLSYTTISLTLNALLVLTAGTGVYAAGKAHRGGWAALFAVALVLGLYGPYFADIAAPYLGLGRVGVVYFEAFDIVLTALAPLLALVYTLRYRARRGAPASMP